MTDGVPDRMIPEPDPDEVTEALVTAVSARGVTVHRWRLRSIHRRGASATSTLVEADVTDEGGRERTLLYVLHRSRRPVPDGATVVELADGPVHVWRFPDDPYLPGLRSAVSRRRGLERLQAAGAGTGTPAIHTRSYRPTRRAVVEVTPPGAESPALYLKVLGGRTPDRRRQRTAGLAAVHEHLGRHLPVPRALAVDVRDATVVLERLPGTTLRSLLRSGAPLPTPAELVRLVTRLAVTPAPPGSARPARQADVGRHVQLLRRLVPDRTDTLRQLATAVAATGGPTGTLHGDLHDGQLLVTDGRVTGLLDVDGAGVGPLALDAGRLVANVEVAGLTVPARARAATAYADELTELLTAVVPPTELARAAAGAWVGLATGPHRVRGEGWRAATVARIDRAARWLART